MIETSVACPNCGRAVRAGKRFCGACGTPLAVTCPSCGAQQSPEDSFCEDCGAPLSMRSALPPAREVAPAATVPPPQTGARAPRPSQERRLATVLFADLVGYTTISERLDPEQVRELQTLYFDRMSAEIARFEGTVEKYAGDAVLALFGVPIAHEDDAERAVRCAMSMQRALETVAAHVRERWGLEVSLRVGVNTGEVVSGTWRVAGREEHAVSGDAVNVAARLQTAARPGEVLVAEDSMRLAQRGIEFGEARELSLKGRGEAVRAFPVLSARQRPVERWEGVHTMAPLVGREHELAVLRGYFDYARAGEGRVVAVTGEAGIGKSRLLRELKRSLEGSGARWIEGHCISYGRNIPYLPIIDMVKSNFGINEGDGEAEIIQRLDVRGAQWSPDARESIRYLKYLLNVDTGDESITTMDPMERRAGILDALRCLVAQESRETSLVVLIEDLHWIDETSEESIAALTDAVAHLPVLLLLTYRPGYTHALSDRTHVSRLAVGYLRPEESVSLTRALLGANEVPAELQTLIAGKAEGNPFYVEEVTRSLLESGLLTRTNGTCALTRPVEEIYIPETIQEIILSRIDRLEQSAKEAMQLASVIGREFTLRLLHRISDVEAQLDDVLSELKTLELIYERSFFPELAYMFKHALTHDVAYSTLLHERRRALHRVVAAAIEELYADRLPEQYEVLAYHYSRGEVWDKAFDYLLLAAEKASAAFANVDALAYYDRALWIVEHHRHAEAAQLMRIYGGKAGAAFALNRWAQVAENWSRVRDIAAREGDRVTEGLALAGVSVGRIWTHEFDEAEARAQEALQLGASLDSDAVRAGAQYCLGFLDVVQGRLAEGEERLRDSIKLSRETGQPLFESLAGVAVDLSQSWQAHYAESHATAQYAAQTAELHQIALPLLWARWTDSLALVGWGRYQEALAALSDTIELCRRMGDVAMQSRAWNTLGWLHDDLYDYAGGARHNRTGLELARTLGDPEIIVNAEVNLADCAFAMGDAEYARAELERLYAALPTLHAWMKWRYGQHIMHSLGEVRFAGGDLDRALELATECLEVAEATSALRNVVKARRLRAQVFLARDRLEEAAQEVALALEVARTAGNPPQLWKTLKVLGDIGMARGRAGEAVTAYREALALLTDVAEKLDEDGLRRSLLASDLVRDLRDRVNS